MKKITLLLAFLLAFVAGNAQVSSYAFSSSVGTYTENTGAATLLPLVKADTYMSPAQNIGFSFVYDGNSYTQFKMSSNGLISFNMTGTSSLTTNDFSTANATSRPIIAPLWDDNDGRTTGDVSVASYELSGTAPNQVLTVEWRNWEWNYSSTTPVMSFQVKLYETTNVIEFVYRQESTAVSAGSASIGIGSATGSGAGSYLNVTNVVTPAVSSVTSITNINTKPVTGQIFTFSPPAACTGTPVGGTVAPANFVLNTGQLPGSITASGYTSGVTGITFQWEESTDGGSNWVNATGGTGATTAVYTPPAYTGTPIMYRVKVTCTTSGLFGYSTTSSIVSCGPVSTFPWTENFDGLSTLGTTSFPSCWLKENGDWSTSNATTYNTPRSGTNYLRDSWSATNEYIWTVGFDLVAGTSYDFSTFVQGDGGTGWIVDMFYNTAPASAGATQLGASYNVPGTGTIAIQPYAEMKRTFVPSSSGTYYFGMRVNQPSSGPWYVAMDDFKLEVTPSCPSPSSLVVNTLTDTSVSVSWAATSGNYQYVLDNVATDPAGAGTNLAGETYTDNSLTPSTTYYLHVRSDCGAGVYSSWSMIQIITPATPPVNDNCINATALTAGGVFADNPAMVTNVGATNSNPPAPGCASFAGGDVWYSVTIPASGSLTIETNNNTAGGSTITDSGLAVYSGDCATLTLVSCDDDSSSDGNFSLITVTGRTPGEVLYVNTWEYGGGTVGTFRISAYDASLSTGSFDTAAFKAYPNPVTNVLNLSYSSDITSVEVYNMLGQKVLTKALNVTQAQVDMSNLNAGNYFVKVTADGVTQTIKVIKQ